MFATLAGSHSHRVSPTVLGVLQHHPNTSSLRIYRRRDHHIYQGPGLQHQCSCQPSLYRQLPMQHSCWWCHWDHSCLYLLWYFPGWQSVLSPHHCDKQWTTINAHRWTRIFLLPPQCYSSHHQSLPCILSSRIIPEMGRHSSYLLPWRWT